MKVAIVEDDVVMALLLEEICRNAGHRVVGTATDARRAIRLLEESLPDCLLVDFALRGERNGLELLEQAKSRLPSLFSIMITAWDINDIACRIGEVQPDRILRKPIHAQALAGLLAARDNGPDGMATANSPRSV